MSTTASNDYIINSLHELTNNGLFNIERIEYDEKNFGNTIVLLRTNNQVYIRFVKDRGSVWCEVGQEGDWYYLEDVLKLYGSTMEIKSVAFHDYIEEVSKLIKLNFSSILRVFTSAESQVLKNRIKEQAIKRALTS